MHKLGKMVALLIVLFITLINSQATQASSIESLAWLTHLSANFKKLQLDTHCPQNQLHDLQIIKETNQVTAQIAKLDWDFNCVKPPTVTPVPTSTPKKSVTLPTALLALPDLAIHFERINLLSPLFKQPFSASLPLQSTDSVMTMSVLSEWFHVNAHLALDSYQIKVDAVIKLAALPRFLSLSKAFTPYLNHDLLLHYETNLKDWQQGDLSVDWQGNLPGFSEQVSLSLVGNVDLSKHQIMLSTVRMDAQAIQSDISAMNSWHSKGVHIINTDPVMLNYQQLSIDNLPLALQIDSSYLLTRVERGESKRIRIDKQKLPPALVQFLIKGKATDLLVDWALTTLQQDIKGQLLLKEKTANLTIDQGRLNMPTLVEQLGHYVEPLTPFDIDTGELLFDLTAEYHLQDRTVNWNSALVATDIAGKKEDILFDGVVLNSHLHYRVDEQQTVEILKDKQQLKIENIFIGIPIQALQLDMRVQDKRAVIDHLKARLLGGRIDVSDFSLSTPRQTSMVLSGMSLAEIIKYSAYPEIQGKGIIDVTLPFTVSDEGLDITDGTIVARAPGGYIKVPENTVIKAMGRGNPAFSFTMQILSNFQFDTMLGEIGYTHDGESNLNVEIKGINPMVSGAQPVNFNYSHSENILKLLKSLRFNEQLVRDIKERY